MDHRPFCSELFTRVAHDTLDEMGRIDAETDFSVAGSITINFNDKGLTMSIISRAAHSDSDGKTNKRSSNEAQISEFDGNEAKKAKNSK